MAIKNIKNILVPLDGSKNSFRGLNEAIYLARQCHATVYGLYVVTIPPPAIDEQIRPLEKLLLTDAVKIMKKAKTVCAQNGVLFHDKILYGDEGVKIVDYAKKKKFDIIVIGSRGRSGLKEIFLGSTSNYVLHKSPIPVLVVK